MLSIEEIEPVVQNFEGFYRNDLPLQRASIVAWALCWMKPDDQTLSFEWYWREEPCDDESYFYHLPKVQESLIFGGRTLWKV